MSYAKAIGQLKNSVSRPTLYKVQMPQRFIGRDTNDYLEYFCSAAQVPSVRYNFLNVMGHGEQGITRLQPSNVVFTNPLTISVIENSDLTTYQAFKEWFDDTGQGISQDGQRSIKLKYFEEIVGDIELTKLEFPDNLTIGGLGSGAAGGSYKEVLKVTFLNAYPKSVGALQLASDQRDSYLTFQVEFNYESYKTDFK